jgi:DNA replication protein DnaC
MTTKSTRSNTTPTDELKSRLGQLGLFGVIAHWQEIDDADVVERIVDFEETERRRRSLERRVKAAQIGKMKVMANFEWGWPTKVDRDAVEDLFRLGFLEEAANVVLVGPNGVGKTMIAKNLAHHAVMSGKSALFVNAADLMNDLRRPDSSSALARRLAHYAKPDVLVVDEVGYLAAGDRDGDLFFQLVSRRYERKPIVITTNKPFAEWNSVFPNSACAVTLVDRLVHRAEIIVFEGESYRLRRTHEHQTRTLRTKNLRISAGHRSRPTPRHRRWLHALRRHCGAPRDGGRSERR